MIMISFFFNHFMLRLALKNQNRMIHGELSSINASNCCGHAVITRFNYAMKLKYLMGAFYLMEPFCLKAVQRSLLWAHANFLKNISLLEKKLQRLQIRFILFY